MSLMARYPDKHFDLAIVDPPYGLGDFRNRGRNKGKFNFIPKSEHIFDNIQWNDSVPDAGYFSELFRVSKNQIIWGANYYWEHIPFRGAIVWNKKQPLSSISQADIAACSLHNKVAYFEYLWAGVMRQKQEKYDTSRIHPCEKPVSLYKWLLNSYASPGNTILDTHLGSGSIAIACHDLGYALTACEKDERYFRAMKDRLQKHTRQMAIDFCLSTTSSKK